MFQTLDGAVPHLEDDVREYIERRWWSGLTLGDLLDRAARDPSRTKKLSSTGRTGSPTRQARERADRLAVGLMELGIEPLDRVLVQLPNWSEFVPAYFALPEDRRHHR